VTRIGADAAKRAEQASESRKFWRESTGSGPTESYLRELTSSARYHHIDGAVYSVGSAFADFLVRKYGMERFLRTFRSIWGSISLRWSASFGRMLIAWQTAAQRPMMISS
jgi:hypothetical protein